MKKILSMILALSMVVTLLPSAAFATSGTSASYPDCYVDGANGYDATGYNWLGAAPAVGDTDLYVQITGTVPDGWTMVGGLWTGAESIDIDANPLLNKAGCADQFTPSLTQISKVRVGQTSAKDDVYIYRLTANDDGALQAGNYRIFFESVDCDSYYVPSIYNLSIPDPDGNTDPYPYFIGDIELPLEISPNATSVDFSCTVGLYGVNPDEIISPDATGL